MTLCNSLRRVISSADLLAQLSKLFTTFVDCLTVQRCTLRVTYEGTEEYQPVVAHAHGTIVSDWQ